MNNEQHPLDRLIWDASNWVTAFNDLLDAVEVQIAIEDELREESDALDGLNPDDEL